MSRKAQEVFQTSNTPTTEGVDSGYGLGNTNLALTMMSTFVQKTELTTIKDVLGAQIESLKKDIEKIPDFIEKRETRFWIINGVIIAALIAIFLFALPYAYYKPIEKQNDIFIQNYNDKMKLLESIITYFKRN
jgi:hypothetical protein